MPATCLQIARKLILAAPPGEVNEVISGLTKLFLFDWNDVSQHSLCVPARAAMLSPIGGCAAGCGCVVVGVSPPWVRAHDIALGLHSWPF